MTPTGGDVMQGATFVLPVRVESPDRLNNLITVARFLRRNYPSSRIIVGTDGDPSFHSMLPDGVEVVELHGPAHLPFHPARAVNDLARLATTPVTVRTEADVIIPPAQMREAVRMAASGEYQLVRPYRTAYTVLQDEREEFAERHLYDAYATDERRLPFEPLGYCAVWNTDAYRRGGMENEHFISWGLDDNERLARAELLGARHTQVDGGIFHLDHSRGSDSLDTTPYYKSNESEYHRIRTLGADHLRTEVASWPWLRGTTSTPIHPLPADDLTIVMWVHDASPDGLRRAAASARAARACTDARIIVGVPADIRARRQFPESVELLRMSQPATPAQRATVLNDLIKRADTELAAILDQGFILPPAQWEAGLAKARGGAGLVLPYDTTVHVPYAAHPWLERADFESLPPRYTESRAPFASGCVLLRRASHRAAGFDNQQIVSPTIGGLERIARYRTLHLRVEQCSGALFCLDTEAHQADGAQGTDGADGATGHSHESDLAEHDRIASMSENDVRAEIATWKWADEEASAEAPRLTVRRPASTTDLDVMRQATFTVPVRIDSADRLSNLIAIVKHLHRNYPSRIVVGSEEPDVLRAVLPREVEILHLPGSVDLPFHHTRMLNDLSRIVETPVLVNIEADIIIPSKQLVDAVYATLTGEAELVLPYNYAVDVRRPERAAFADSDVTAHLANGRSRYSWPVIGGCMVWNRAAFQRVGMENEHFISWGLEDDERLLRTEKLGGVVSRVAGPLFHLQHDRGPDSGKATPYYTSNRIELERIRKKAPERLVEEVRRWPWVAGTTSLPFEPVPTDDLTVTIPVRIDTPDRLLNLIASTKALRATITARVIVGVGDPDSIRDYLPDGVEVVAVDDQGPFHRTRILNDLARRVSTEFVANHDTDVIATIDQWRETMALLRDGADFVLPFDAGLVDYPYGHHAWMQRAAYTSMPPFSYGPLNLWSVGGCVVWRRASFFAAGMENEHFVSWGAEDDERIHRARTLGLRVERAKGPMMHLRHRRGPESSRDNPHFAANEAELARIIAMSPDQLAAEVATWPWCGPSHR